MERVYLNSEVKGKATMTNADIARIRKVVREIDEAAGVLWYCLPMAEFVAAWPQLGKIKESVRRVYWDLAEIGEGKGGVKWHTVMQIMSG